MNKVQLIFILVCFLIFVGCSREEGDNLTALPSVEPLNTNVSNEIIFSVIFEQGDLLDYYLLDGQRIEPGTRLGLVQKRYRLEAVPVKFDNGTENLFKVWDNKVKDSVRYYYPYVDDNIRADFYNATYVRFNARGTAGQVLVEGYGLIDVDYATGGLYVPSGEKIKVTVVTPSAYEFLYWGDGDTELTKEIEPIPYETNFINFRKYVYWQDNAIYEAGERVSHNGKGYEAIWGSVGEEPGLNTHNAWYEITVNGEWSPTKVYRKGDVCYYNDRMYIAYWWTRGVVPTDPNSGFFR